MTAPKIPLFHYSLVRNLIVTLVKCSNVGLPAKLEWAVYVKGMYYNEPIERLYNSASFDDICINRAGD